MPGPFVPVFPDDHAQEKQHRSWPHPPQHPNDNPNAEPGYWPGDRPADSKGEQGAELVTDRPPTPSPGGAQRPEGLIEPQVLNPAPDAPETILEPHDEAPVLPYCSPGDVKKPGHCS